MLYTPLVNRALEICYNAHKDQKDKAGLPYILHPFTVAHAMPNEEDYICAALLHDVIENSYYTADDLRQNGFNENIIKAVEILTRPADIDYMDYIDTIKHHTVAREVKMADLIHNMDLGRLPKCTEKDLKRAEKYRKAYLFLLDAKLTENNIIKMNF